MRPPCCDKSSVKRGLWTAEEDAKILAYISRHGTGNWTSVPKKAGLKRCGKSCRLRWTNYLRPDLKHDRFTTEEEELIVTLHATMGSRWSMIASQLPGRTDNDVKNYWNTKLRKKLRERGIDPVTHKPISQVFAHLGSIGLPKLSKTSQHYQSLKDNNRISCLNRDLRNGFMVKQETTTQTPPTSISNFSKMDPPPQDSLLANPAWDLLAQIQAIKLVAEASSYANQENNQTQVQFFNENVPLIIDPQPTSFSSQACETPENTESSFSWSEFLLEDPFLPPNQDNFQASSSSGSYQDSSHGPKFMGGEDGDLVMGMDENGLLQHQYSCDLVPPSPVYGAMCSERSGFYGACSENSFVDDLLESDSQLLWEFPELLDNPSLYSDGLL